jgi:hypothetical protein
VPTYRAVSTTHVAVPTAPDLVSSTTNKPCQHSSAKRFTTSVLPPARTMLLLKQSAKTTGRRTAVPWTLPPTLHQYLHRPPHLLLLPQPQAALPPLLPLAQPRAKLPLQQWPSQQQSTDLDFSLPAPPLRLVFCFKL